MSTTLFRHAALALVLLAGARPTLPASILNDTISMDMILTDPCSGEDVHFAGVAYISANRTINNNQAHAFALVNMHLIGQGLTSGAAYILNGTGTGTTTVDNVTSTGEVTILVTQPVIGLGGVSDAIAQVHFHVTVNANGIVTAVFSDGLLICN